ILAAAGLYALVHNVERLADDHANAKRLAEGLARTGAFAPIAPDSNIVVADILRGDLDSWLHELANAGVLAVPFGPRRMRMVTHLGVSAADVEDAIARIERVAGLVAA
ncbi:MAG: low specificity L-threonine aldolase, partial [Tepidiformaceae bacterium]